MSDIIHIVSRFDGIGGTEYHAASLAALLRPTVPTVLWADEPTLATHRYGAKPINTFGGDFPRGGTLVLIGTHFRPGAWIDHVRPKRLIVVINLFSANRVFAMLAHLDRPSMPVAELAFVSEMLKRSLGLPGRICPALVDLERFHPRRHREADRFTIGRHSRDILLKHHPDDISLYAMLAWSGAAVRLMGARCLKSEKQLLPLIELLPTGIEPAEDFLAGLHCFVYRTHPQLPEAGGRVVMEALASGVPVIASPAGGYAEWIESGENGYLAATQEEFYDRLLELMNAPETCRRLGLQARDSAVRLSGDDRRDDYLRWLIAD